ncbi:DUF2155 domain-containing protein [Rubellimicrobium roseum]|uniref:DUF2155 domain-containing protein n=1 Tax=Rubellimicrobium roseum TaxID=687525 RepID=A0A5C4NL63_9RHOB|nr:DUF2155 domain-containing protein [Rubellimicrobium roseum]TNC73866.1 DUF2155 domain-containing protein [Rubellimicrobium roseum]
MRLALLAACLATPLAAQDTLSLDPPARRLAPENEAERLGAVTSASGGIVRVLDKIIGTVTDLELRTGETAEVGAISVTMGDCRYPTANPAGDAYALVSVRTRADDAAVFEGWLIASAPALSAVDHPRYDVWALRCLGV